MNNCTYSNVGDVLETNYLPYAVSVTIDRAFLDIDGFKPSHRKLLYTMYKMNIKNRTKSANIVGQTMKLNPHSDSSIYETMVRMTKNNESLLLPLVDSKGNFGKVYSRDMAYAASRYTEASLMPICKELFNGIDKNNVNMIDNYDNTAKEPELLPCSFPILLANCNMGVAVGFASNICSFNLNELCDYTINQINNAYNKPLIPDFSTGGKLIYNQDELIKIDNNGTGKVVVRANYTYDKVNNCIEITEIPYTTTVEVIIDKLEELIKSNKIKEITDVRDESDLSGLKLTIDLKRNVDADLLMSKLYKLTSLEDSFSCNFNIIIDKKPKLLGVKQIISHWLDFRKQCLKREVKYDIIQTSNELNKLQGLSLIINDLDKAIELIRYSKSEQEAQSKLESYFNLNKEQSEYICTIKLININSEWIKKRTDKLDEVKQTLHTLENNINSDTYYNQTIVSQLEYIKKTYGQPRKTTVIEQEELQSTQQVKESLIDPYNCYITLTSSGYIKKTMRSSDNHKLKDGDTILQQLSTTNKSKLLLFSNKSNVYYLNCYDIESVQPSTLGTYIRNQLQLNKDESIIYLTTTEDYKGYMLFTFENGKIAKIPLESYKTLTNRTKVINAYNTTSQLISIHYIESDIDMVITSTINKVLVFNTSQINSKVTKSSSGVNVLKSKNDSTVAKCEPIKDGLDEEMVNYYRANINATGKYLRKGDEF